MTNAERFEARLKAEGYPEIRFNEFEDVGPEGVRYIAGRRPR